MSRAASTAPRGDAFWRIVEIVAWAILAVLLIAPLWTIMIASFTDNVSGGWSLSNYRELFARNDLLVAIFNTIVVGVGGALGAMILGLTLAVITTRFQIPGRVLIQTVALIALVAPPFIGAYAWIVLFGSNGIVRTTLAGFGIDIPPIFGMPGVILVFALKFMPHVFLITSAALANVNRSVEEAAESLGVTPLQRFFRITLPLITPAIAMSALLAFVLSIADFGTPKLIGRNTQVLATKAFDLFTGEVGGNPGMASALSIALMAISLVVIWLQRRAVSRDVYHNSLTKPVAPSEVRGVKALALNLIAWTITLSAAMPVIVVAIFSFRRTRGPVFQDGFGLDSYRRVMATVTTPIINTLVYSFTVTFAIVVVGTLIGYLIARRPKASTALLDGLLMAPYVVPGIVIGIAFIARFNDPPIALTGTGLVIMLAVFIRRLPYAARSVAASLKQVSGSLEEAAISLGYSPARAFVKVTAPLIGPGILAGALMSFVTAMNELSSSLVLYVGRTITMPVRIYLAVSDGEYGTASALSAMLLAMTGVAVYVAFRVAGRKASALV